MPRIQRRPLAFGMEQWGPLPGTDDLYLFWGGPGDGLWLHKGWDGRHVRVRHKSASATYDALRYAEAAVYAFVAEGVS